MTLLFFYKYHAWPKRHGKQHFIEDFDESRRKLRQAAREIVPNESKETKLKQAEAAIEYTGSLDETAPVSEEMIHTMLSYMDSLRSYNEAEYLRDKVEQLIIKQELLAKAQKILEMQEEEELAVMLLLH